MPRRLALAAVLAATLATPALAEEVVVFAAASLKEALDAVAADFQAETGNSVTISYAGSNALAKQIIEGAPADIFISAAVNWMDEVEKAGLVVPDTREDLLGNTLVLVAHGKDAKPVEIGPLRLVDGGMLNNVPVDVVRKMGADVVIAVDVLPSFTQNAPGEPPVIVPLQPKRVLRAYRDLWHVVMIMTSAATDARLQQWPPDVMLRPPLAPDIDVLLGFNRQQDAIAAGVAATEAALDQILAAIGRAPAVAIDNDS